MWVLPGLVAALTPIRYRDILRPTRDAFLTAFVAATCSSCCRRSPRPAATCSARHVPERNGIHAATLPDVIVPASFNFPHTGKLLSLSFVLFAGWFANVALPYTSYPALAFTGLLTFFGSLSAAVPFLLDMFRIPADTFQLFIATGVINQRVGSLLAAVHTVTIGLLGSAAIAGAIRFDVRRVTRYVVVTLCLVGRPARLAARPVRDRPAAVLRRHRHRHRASSPCSARAPLSDGRGEPARPPGSPVLDGIRAAGTVRVCYVDGRPPFAFTNRNRELVGLDIEMAHQLAIDLQVTLQLVPTTIADYAESLDAKRLRHRAWAGSSPRPCARPARPSAARTWRRQWGSSCPTTCARATRRGTGFASEAQVRIGFPDLPYFRRQVQTHLPRGHARPARPVDRSLRRRVALRGDACSRRSVGRS